MHLSETDKKILTQLSQGKTVKEVARAIFKSSSTINQRLTRLREKTDCRNIAHLIHYFSDELREKI